MHNAAINPPYISNSNATNSMRLSSSPVTGESSLGVCPGFGWPSSPVLGLEGSVGSRGFDGLGVTSAFERSYLSIIVFSSPATSVMDTSEFP